MEHRGLRLVDAAVFEPVPFRAAIADGCTHVLALCTRPPYMCAPREGLRFHAWQSLGSGISGERTERRGDCAWQAGAVVGTLWGFFMGLGVAACMFIDRDRSAMAGRGGSPRWWTIS